MISVLYLVFLLGSFSIGYSLLRIGFPEIQKEPVSKKLGMGYLLGLIVFLPSILTIFLDLEVFFFLFAIGAYGFIATIMFIIRIYHNKEDNVELIETKKEQFIPKKALAPEEKEEEKQDKSHYENKDDKLEDDYSKFKIEKAKELNVEDKMKKANHSTTGKNEHGLFVKDSTTTTEKSQRQIFKEKEPNVINKLRQKTIDEDEKTKKALNEKDKILNNLKELAKKNEEKNLNEKKDKKTNLDEDLEDLTEIDEEF